MHPLKALLFVVGLVWLATPNAVGQRTTYKGKKLSPLRSYNDPALTRAKTGSTIPLFDEGGYPYQGIGIKVGDPMAVTFKFYVSEHFAVVADFGKSTSSFYKSYYAQLFDIYFPDPFDTLTYVSHRAKADWVGEVKLLYQRKAYNLMKGLQFYGGLGLEMRDTKLKYTFNVEEPAEPATLTEQRRYSTRGLEAVLGAEYAAFGLPLSFFIEAEYYYDLVKDPGWTRLQGGIGVRYVF